MCNIINEHRGQPHDTAYSESPDHLRRLGNPSVSGRPSLTNWAIVMNEHIEHCGEMSSKSVTDSDDLSYWTGWNESYQPEVFPLGMQELPKK